MMTETLAPGEGPAAEPGRLSRPETDAAGR